MDPFKAVTGPAAGGVEAAGFTLVEEDDVAFTLQLCREVHRLYGEYQRGDLPSDDHVLSGLAVTMEMLAVLSRRVTGGMPAMRITVAAAQTREILAVMFGRDPLEAPLDRRFRARSRAVVDESARALSPPAPAAVLSAAPPRQSEVRPSRIRRLFRRRPAHGERPLPQSAHRGR